MSESEEPSPERTVLKAETKLKVPRKLSRKRRSGHRQFRVPRRSSWEVTRMPRAQPVYDRVYRGPCQGPNGDFEPKLRSTRDLYRCVRTKQLAKLPYCRGNRASPPCWRRKDFEPPTEA